MLPQLARVYVCTKPVDLRKGFDSLAQLVREYLGADPLSGHLFLFRNCRCDRVKLLYWDRGGYVIIYKRLEQGTFRFPAATDENARLEMHTTDLAMLLDGVDLKSVKRQKLYTPATSAQPTLIAQTVAQPVT